MFVGNVSFRLSRTDCAPRLTERRWDTGTFIKICLCSIWSTLRRVSVRKSIFLRTQALIGSFEWHDDWDDFHTRVGSTRHIDRLTRAIFYSIGMEAPVPVTLDTENHIICDLYQDVRAWIIVFSIINHVRINETTV